MKPLSILVLLIILNTNVMAWSCNKGCPTAVWSGKFECLAWKKLNCNGSKKTGKGCGSGWNTHAVRDRYGGANFREACDKHDKCYEVCDKSKKSCDKEFRSNLRNECRSTFRKPHEKLIKDGCLKISETYYQSVKSVGEDAYKDAQKVSQCPSQASTSPMVNKYKSRNTGVINTPTSAPRVEIVAVDSNYDRCKSGVYFGFSSYCAPYKEIQPPVDRYGAKIYQSTARILMKRLNIRQSPSISSPVIGELQKNECIKIYNCRKYSGDVWCETAYPTGYIRKSAYSKGVNRISYKYGCD